MSDRRHLRALALRLAELSTLWVISLTPLNDPVEGVAVATGVSWGQDLKTHVVTHLGSERVVGGPGTRPTSKQFLYKVFLASQEVFFC